MIVNKTSHKKSWKWAELDSSGLTAEMSGADLAAIPGICDGRYRAAFAVSSRSIEAALRLRYEVFNIELDEGLTESAITGLDRDAFDDQMTHLLLVDTHENEVAGTYRMQTLEQASAGLGAYSAQEFDMEPLRPHLHETTELGRACLAREHRTLPALLTLWQGIGAFMNMHNQRYLCGCCSITSQEADDGWRALRTIRRTGALDAPLLQATPAYSCGSPSREFAPDLSDGEFRLPKLFKTYLRLGARVISEPAIDRDFGTVDFLVFLDARGVRLSQLDVLK